MPPRKPSCVVNSAPREDGQLSVVEVDWTTKRIVFSSGEETYTHYEKLLTLAEQVCQERAVVWMRDWIRKDGHELIELKRVGEASSATPTATTWTEEGVF